MEEIRAYSKEELAELLRTDRRKYFEVTAKIMAAIGSYVIKDEKELPDKDRKEWLPAEFWDDKIREYFRYAYNRYMYKCVEGDDGAHTRNYFSEDLERCMDEDISNIKYDVKTLGGSLPIRGNTQVDDEAVRFMIFMLSAVYNNFMINYSRFAVSYRLDSSGNYLYHMEYPVEKLHWSWVQVEENRILSEVFQKMVGKVLLPLKDLHDVDSVLDKVSNNGCVYLERFKRETISEEARLKVIRSIASYW